MAIDIDYRHGMSTGYATGGAVSIFAAFGIGLMVLAFAAAFSLRNLETGAVNPNDVTVGASVALVTLLPFLVGPVLSTLAGTWAGTRTGGAGSGATAGALGSLVGVILMFILVAIGFALGVAVAAVDLTAITQTQGLGVPTGFGDTLGYFASLSGILYLIGNVVIGAVAGALIGWLVHKGYVVETPETTRRSVRV